MPSKRLREEVDSRAPRFESEVRASNLEEISRRNGPKRLYFCGKCHRLFEERSRYCPRCDTKTMYEVKPK